MMRFFPVTEQLFCIAERMSNDEIADLFRACGAYAFDSYTYEGVPKIGSMAEAVFNAIVIPLINEYSEMTSRPAPNANAEPENGFQPPTRDEVDEWATDYCDRHGIDPREFDVDAFFEHYEANGWRTSARAGKKPLKCWKHAVHGWLLQSAKQKQ